MTDLIARLEDLEKEETPGPWNSRWYVEGATQEEWGPASPLVARIEYANSNCVGKRHIPWSQTDADLLSELRNNLPAILRALRVQEAAEVHVRAIEASDRDWWPDEDSTTAFDVYETREALVRVVKGEQP